MGYWNHGKIGASIKDPDIKQALLYEQRDKRRVNPSSLATLDCEYKVPQNSREKITMVLPTKHFIFTDYKLKYFQ